jgi:potassium channel subfamily K
MIIINAFLRFTNVTYQRVRVCFSSNTQASTGTSEATGLLSARSPESRASLTAGDYEDFYHSWDAIWVCLFHAVVYYTVAVVSFSFLVEKWPIIDSLYFATTIFTTIGFGDLHPTSNSGQCLTIVLALYGVVILGIFIGILGEVRSN